MGIKWKLIIMVLSIGLSIALASYIMLHRAEKGPRNIAEFQTPALYLIQEMHCGIAKAVEESFAYIISGDQSGKEHFYKNIKLFDIHASQFKKTDTLDPEDEEERELFKALISGRETLVKKAEVMFQEYGTKGSVSHKVFEEYEDSVDQLVSDLERFVSLEKEDVETMLKEAIATMDSVHDAYIVIGALAVVLSLVFGFLISKTITVPILELRNAAIELGEGQLDTRVEIRSRDEVGQLAQSFNQMAKDLETSKAEIESSHWRLKFLLTSSPSMIYTCKTSGDYGATFISENVEWQLGYTPQQFIEDSGFWASRIHPEDSPKVFAELPRLFEQGHHSHEYRFQHKDGRYLWMHDEMNLVHNEDGEPVEIIGSWIDITQRKIVEEEIARLNVDLERRVIERTAELEATNRELKDFASIVSHDLKAPLRGIGSLADWISTDYGDRLGEEGKSQMGMLLDRVKRMNNLIEGILEYSRAGRIQEERVEVDLSQMITEVIDSIAPPRNIRVAFANGMPTLVCERIRMAQVFQNLISNGVKFMDKPEGEIRIGCAGDDGQWRFWVSDNGPGIDAIHFDKIFQIFQTLRPRDQFESTGVGLSIVKKIVEKWGGKVWVESKVGEGTTFFFTMPKNK